MSRIKKLLPNDIKIAYKTGTWWDNTSSGKKYNYTNETALITLPENKGHIAISIYIKSNHSDIEKQKYASEKAAKLVYDSISMFSI